jgi:uncharacterized membrane protein YecN with MAPEG domain
MPVVPLYASVLALIFVGLSIRTVRLRQRLRVAVGDAGNESMLRAMRVHSNFAEYVPLSLLLFYFVESVGASHWLIHALGTSLIVGRVAHAYGLSRSPEPMGFRVVGMALTFTPMIVAAIGLLAAYVRQAMP